MSARYSYARQVASTRPRSEDAAEVFERDDALVVVLADGSGDLRGGATASATLVAAVRAKIDDAGVTLGHAAQWGELLRATDAALAAKRAGETTGVIVVLGPRGVIGAGTGNSEAWIVDATHVENLTAGQEVKRKLGSGRVTPAIFERPPLSGVLVVATDGLFKFAAAEVIARIVRENAAGPACERLIELVRLRSGKFADDVAVVLVGVNVQ